MNENYAMTLVMRYQRLAVAQWMDAKEILWIPSSELGELVRAQDVIVRVVGSEPAECYIIIGPISNGVETSTYFILPYGYLEDS